MRVNEPIWVVKVGGRAGDEATLRARLAAACAAAPARVVLVHGGGNVVTKLQERLQQTPTFVAGRRVTLPEHMAAVEMALSGAFNKGLVRALLSVGARAVGVSGVDGGMVRCRLAADLGAVGEPEAVDAALLRALLTQGLMPVVSPVSLGPQGEAVNVNADEFACALAAALAAERLFLLSDVPAVRVGGADRALIAAGEVEALIAAGDVAGGMIPKVRSAVRALHAGVAEVRIAALQDSLQAVTGTLVRLG